MAEALKSNMYDGRVCVCYHHALTFVPLPTGGGQLASWLKTTGEWGAAFRHEVPQLLQFGLINRRFTATW